MAGAPRAVYYSAVGAVRFGGSGPDGRVRERGEHAAGPRRGAAARTGGTVLCGRRAYAPDPSDASRKRGAWMDGRSAWYWSVALGRADTAAFFATQHHHAC